MKTETSRDILALIIIAQVILFFTINVMELKTTFWANVLAIDVVSMVFTWGIMILTLRENRKRKP